MEKVTVIDTQSVIWLKTRTQAIKTVTFSPRQRGEKTICPLFHFRATCQLRLFIKYPQWCDYLESYRQIKRLVYLVLFLVLIVFASQGLPSRNAIWRPLFNKRLSPNHGRLLFTCTSHMYTYSSPVNFDFNVFFLFSISRLLVYFYFQINTNEVYKKILNFCLLLWENVRNRVNNIHLLYI